MSETYASTVPFVDEAIQAAAVYCSDGRMATAFEDFLSSGLGIERCDRVVMPGGPAALANHPESQAEGVLDDLVFLIEAHELDRVILIQHAGCAFYGQVLGVTDEQLPSLQHADLVRAAHALRSRLPSATIETYTLAIDGDRITFPAVDID